MTDELRALLITLRRALPDDEAFLYQLYGDTRSEEMRAWGLEAAQQEMSTRCSQAGGSSCREAEPGCPSLRATRLLRHPGFRCHEPRWRHVDRHGTEALILILSWYLATERLPR